MSSPPSVTSEPTADLLAPPLPRETGARWEWGRLRGAAAALALAGAAREQAGLTVVVTPDPRAAARLIEELRFFLADDAIDVLGFPDWETLPYDLFSPLPELVSERIEALYRLPTLGRGVLVVPVTTLLQRLPPRRFIGSHSFIFEPGQRLEIDAVRLQLENAGYSRVSQVLAHGEYAVRGALLDLFPMGSRRPIRIDLLDDEIDTLREFDPETQRSLEGLDRVRLLPAREFPFDDAAIARFRQGFRVRFEGDPQRSLIYREVSEQRTPGGIEYYFPLFFEATDTLFDYLPASRLVAIDGAASDAAEGFLAEVRHRFEQRRPDIERPPLPPETLYLDGDELQARLKREASVVLRSETLGGRRKGFAGVCNFPTRLPPPLAIQARAERPALLLEQHLAQWPGRTLFVAESAGRRELLLDTLRGFGIAPKVVAGWAEFRDGDMPLALAVAPLEEGMQLDAPALALITEAQLYGERVRQPRRQRSKTDPDQIVRNLTELHEGAPVVHEEHGVGRYLGLQTLDVAGMRGEFLALEYANGDKLYVPVSSLHLIGRYSGASPETAPLHRLGSDQWSKARRRAAEKARDVAAELLEIYARRAAHPGHAFTEPGHDYRAFAAAFPFEETPDQQAAIDAVLADLEAPRPMDRVVCGDVGFGKTEVALRAAFVAVQGGRQVAVLVPTTLLAQQHYQNFADRFADWPVRIESLSRFRTAKEQQRVLDGLADGTVDIVVGTHKLLAPEIRFKRLGLVIVDEEHRFGVRHKERLKALRASVDLLTLTATPIPRTLNMAMAGLRDLSIIGTPPAERHPIKTFVGPWSDTLIREACERELKRGGQVYFLHNEVGTIDRIAAELRDLLPGARIEIAHGQMRERELEAVMRDFYHQRFNLLVCTTIIESGIDVPSANTIVINRADKLGLAQLHQLRGRVGRSHHRAYAYLITPPPQAMTVDAKKRLEAIESLEDLGAGFTLATHDLEIRGAGELLGDEQSGQIQEIGFALYSELLERAVAALKAGREPQLDRPLDHGAEIDLRIPALIPADYLPDVHSRLVLYKRIASAESRDELRELEVEMIDRFGLLPPSAKNLVGITGLKLRARPLGIRKLDAGADGGRIRFNPEPGVDPARIIELIQTRPREFRLDGADMLRFSAELADPEQRIERVGAILAALAGS